MSECSTDSPIYIYLIIEHKLHGQEKVQNYGKIIILPPPYIPE